jgi:hypothetical protein
VGDDCREKPSERAAVRDAKEQKFGANDLTWIADPPRFSLEIGSPIPLKWGTASSSAML